MNKLDFNDLKDVKGGENTVSGTLVNALTGIINILYEAGVDLGSSIRRIFEDDLCPLK